MMSNAARSTRGSKHVVEAFVLPLRASFSRRLAIYYAGSGISAARGSNWSECRSPLNRLLRVDVALI